MKFAESLPKRLCYWTIRLACGVCAIIFAILLSPLWTAKGSSQIPAITFWFVTIAILCRGVFGGAIRRKHHLLVRTPFWTHRVQWVDIRDVQLVRGRRSSGLAIELNSGKHLNLWGTSGSIWFPAADSWVGFASQELQRWISDSK